MYPAKFPGLGEALIFFCFFSSLDGRKEDHSKAEKNALFLMSIIRLLPKTLGGRMQYAPTARYLTGFTFVLPKIWVKPAGFHSDLWQSPKPAGFYAMSCGRVQNPPGFALCRVVKSKTRRVLRYVVWQSPKPAGFYAMSCGEVQNPPGFTLCRLAECETYQVSGCRGVLHTLLGRLRKGTFVPMTLFILK